MKKNNLSELYDNRFNSYEQFSKNNIWKIITENFFQKYSSKEAKILDIACGNGEFINSITAKEKYAIDLNPKSKSYLNKNIEFINKDVFEAIKYIKFKKIKFDLIFCSNFLEHIRNKGLLVRLMNALKPLLNANGKLLIMGPNFKYSYKNYWDFFDHHIPLSDKSIDELLAITGYKVIERYPKFVPFSTKSNLPKFKILIYIYLKIKFLWIFFGKQFLFIATK